MKIVAVVALAVGFALLVPARAGAPTLVEYGLLLVVVPPLQGGDAATLHLSIKDGEARPSGWFRFGQEVVLVPRAEGSSVQFADANGNGDAGLTLAEIALVDVRTGRPATAVLRPPDGEDIDASGVYAATLDVCVGSECTRLDGELRAVVNAFRGGGTR